MKNERLTEDIVREHFKRDPLFDVIKIEEQQTSVLKAKKCLSKASKHGTGKPGYPEFIITIPAFPDDIIVVECKANPNSHKSQTQNRTTDYSVDGVLHYSRFLSDEYNVFSIAVSGTDKKKLRVSSFYQKRNESFVSEEDASLLSIFSCITKIKDEAVAQNIESNEITKVAIELNKELNDYSIVEHERCTLVSAILLALQDEAFRNSYESQARTKNLQPKPERLAKSIVDAINRVFQDNEIDETRVSTMISEYETIKNKALAKESTVKKKRSSDYKANFVIRDITQKLETKILPLIHMGDKGYDVLGRFYTEFIRYAGTDKKTGLVLTPKHITEFFCDVVDLHHDDIVLDSCCGTGGFLIAAMKRMLSLSGNDTRKKSSIKSNQIIGIEKRTDMFTFACSNMMMSGDGKSNIYQGDSFSEDNRRKIRALKPTVAFLNPPYDVGEDGQLEFIENALSCLENGGRCAAVVQMSCVTSTSASAIDVRMRLLKNHTLKAVFSTPNDLFHPVGVITCIMVLKAHHPHPKNLKTYFGYYKNDGFVKRKKFGRVDTGEWRQIKTKWLDNYLNKENEEGVSITYSVTPEDEWCAEAYMKTDYSTLTDDDFINTIKNYVASQFLSESKSQ